MLHLRRNRGTEAVESTGTRRVRAVVKAAFAATAGWLLVNVARKARQKADQSSTPGDEAEGTGTTTAPSRGTGTNASATSAGKAATTKGSTKTKPTAGEGPAERHTGQAKPAGATAGKANSSES